MTTYSMAFKSRMVRRLIGPQAISANALAQEIGVSQESLSRWLRASRIVDGMAASNPKKKWTGAAKLGVLTAAQGLSESELGALLRREGLHATELAAHSSPRAGTAAQGCRVSGDGGAARAEKKVQAIWGDADDATDPRHES